MQAPLPAASSVWGFLFASCYCGSWHPQAVRLDASAGVQRLPVNSKVAAEGTGSGVQSSARFCNCFDDAFECSHHYRDAAALLMTTIY